MPDRTSETPRPIREPGRTGMDRRTIIKAAAVAGVGAWTAPVIIESLTSPAAAETNPLQPGTYWYLFKATYNAPNCSVTLQSTAQCANPSGPTCGATRIQPGDPGETLVTGTFTSCVSNAGLVNQGICWTTSQGTVTGIDLVLGACGTAGFGGCFSQPACAGTGTMSNPTGPSTASTTQVWYPIIQITV